jgi:hypothetical protein
MRGIHLIELKADFLSEDILARIHQLPVPRE